MSAAYVKDGKLAAAVLCNLYLNEIYTAIRGQGAFCKGKPISVLKQPLENGIVLFGTSPYHIIKSYTNFGTFLTVLYVSQYRDAWEEDFNLIDENMQVCYVKNLSDDLCSEFGYIGFRKQIGGLVRVS